MLKVTVIIVAIAAASASAGAQSVDRHRSARPQPPPLRGASVRLARPTAHTVYGIVTNVSDSHFILRRRNGQPLIVDWSAAFRDGTYSAPIFVGKSVAVEGDIGRDGMFFATRVSRGTSIDATTDIDH